MKHLNFLILLFWGLSCWGQDQIYLQDAYPVDAVNIVIGKDRVTYNLYNNPNGPELFAYKKDIIKIVSKDGTVKTFNSQESPNNIGTTSKEGWRNPFMEVSYILIPSSLTHGAELHFDVPPKAKNGKIWKFLFGFGGGYAKHTYRNYDFDGYSSDVTMQRIFAHGTLGFRLSNRVGGIIVRTGYNYMLGIYNYNFDFQNDPSVSVPSQKKHFHRIHYEVVAFKSFSKRKPGVGILAGVQYLYAPKKSNENLFLLKFGLGF